eukprot:gene25714-727_t
MSTTTLKLTLMRNPRIGGEVIVVLGYNSTAGKKVVRALRSCCNESTLLVLVGPDSPEVLLEEAEAQLDQTTANVIQNRVRLGLTLPMKRPPRLLYDPRMGGSGVGERRTQKGRHNDTLMATKPPPPPEITWVPGSPQSFNLELGWVQAFAGATCVLDLSMHTVPRWGASWTEVTHAMRIGANVVEAVRAHGVPKLVAFSSVGVVEGERDARHPVSESHPPSMDYSSP